jgi:very-short-patch-repair endonuclease
MFCGKECKNSNSVKNHQRLCKQNPDRQSTPFMKGGLKPWNKGLTKETDERVAKQSLELSAIMKEKSDSGELNTPWSKTFWTSEQRTKKSLEKIEHYEKFPENHPNRKLAGNRNKMTYPEQIAFDWFVKNEIVAESQKQINKWFVDFCVDSIIIEIDGERFHPIGNESDSARDKELTSLGYVVHRIRSNEHIESRLEEIFG